MQSPSRLSLIIAALVLAGVCAVKAEPVLNLTFDDPQGLIKSKPEGVSKLTPDLMKRTATLATGTGGKALPMFPNGMKEGDGTSAGIQILDQPALGAGSFFRATLDGASTYKSIGIRVLPDSAETSLAALVTYQDGKAHINGTLDFVFRATDESGSTPSWGLWTKCGPLGLNVSLAPGETGLAMKVFTKENMIDSNGDNVADKAAIAGHTTAGVRIESGQIYHLAIVFQTDAVGSVTVDVCLGLGDVPLDTGSAVVATASGFVVLVDVEETKIENISISLNQVFTTQTLDLAGIRVMKSAPVTIPSFRES